MQVKQSRFTLILLAIVAAGLLVLIASLALLQHLNAETANRKEQFTSLKKEYDLRETQMLHLKVDEEHLEKLKARLAQLDKNLISYEYVPTYLKQIQGTTLRTMNMISSIQPGDKKPLDLSNSFFAMGKQAGTATEPGATAGQAQAATPPPAGNAATEAGATVPPKGPQYQVMSINLDVQGSYLSIVKLLNEFRQFPKMIYVKSIDLTPQHLAGGATVTARIQTYAIITPDQSKAEDPGQPNLTNVQGGGHK